MNAESLKRANEITTEVKVLNEAIDKLTVHMDPEKNHDYRLSLGLVVRSTRDGWYCYPNSGYMPHDFQHKELNFLSEQLEDDLQFIASRLISSLQKRIKLLEHEFDTL